MRRLEKLAELRQHALALEQEQRANLEFVPEGHRESSRNLLHYLSLRQL